MLRELSDWDQLNIYISHYQGNICLKVGFVMGMGMWNKLGATKAGAEKSLTTPLKDCNIPGGMLWDGSGCQHVCAWECALWMSLYLFQLLMQVLLSLLAGYCSAQVTQFYTPI